MNAFPLKKLLPTLLAIPLLFASTTVGKTQDIFEAIKSNDLARVAALIEKDSRVKDQLDPGKMSPLHHALQNQNMDLFRLLIRHKADVNISGRGGRTPLHFAVFVSKNPMETIPLLLDAGAHIDTKDGFGYPALVYAAQGGLADAVNLLVSKNADLPVEPPNGPRLLFACAQHGLKDLMSRLVAKGADLQTDGLLHAASSGGRTEIIEILLSRGVNIERRRQGWTPLHFASYEGRLAAIDLLLSKGADLNARTEGMGQSCANLADENGKNDAVELLEKKGLKRSPAAFPDLRGEYLGQPKPGRKAEVFAPGIVNVPQTLHSSIVFSPSGREAFWSFAFDNDRTMVSRMENGRWTYPQRAVFQGIPLEDVPVFHPDGTALFDLARARPYPDGKKRGKEDIWIWERSGGEIRNPRLLPDQVNAFRHHWQFGVDRRGNLYFSPRFPLPEGSGIFVCRLENGAYLNPENLGTSVNSTGGEGFPFIAPDGGYLLFVRGMDIYASFREPTGAWTPAKPLGPEVNTPGTEILPTVSPDGRFLFFKRDSQLFWIDAGVIEDLRQQEGRSRDIFDPQGRLLAEGRIFSTACRDLDGDNRPDIAVSDFLNPARVLFNEAGLEFKKAVPLTPPADAATKTSGHGVAAGDLNGDGRVDLFLVYNGHPARLLFGDGKGGFRDGGRAIDARGRHATGAKVADVDGDGDLDVFISYPDGPGGLYLNDRNGALTESDQALPGRLAVGDLDGDGDPDLISPPLKDGEPSLIQLNEKGRYILQDGAVAVGEGIVNIALADADADGDLDLFAWGRQTRGFLWMNDGRGTFRRAEQEFDSGKIAAGDIDGDGIQDLVFGPGVWLGKGSGRFEKVQTLPGVDALELVDFDGDGDLDLLAGRGDIPSGKLNLWLYMNTVRRK